VAAENMIRKDEFEDMKNCYKDKIIQEDKRRVQKIAKDIIGIVTRHLHGSKLDWKVLVVKDSKLNAHSVAGGKIILFDGLFEYFESDGEIVTIIGHEVL